MQVTHRQEDVSDDATVLHTWRGCEGPALLAGEAAWWEGSTWRLGWLLPRRPPNAHEHHSWILLGTWSSMQVQIECFILGCRYSLEQHARQAATSQANNGLMIGQDKPTAISNGCHWLGLCPEDVLL